MTIIVTREHADFDALAAQVAAAKIYPQSEVLLPQYMQPEVALFAEKYKKELSLENPAPARSPPRFETAVVVDTRQKSHLEPVLPLLEQAVEIHIFDHHPPASDDIEGDEIRAEQVGAVTTLLVEEIRHRRIPLNEIEVLLFLLGIYHDTALLSNAATTPRDAAAVAFLWEQGLDPALVQEYIEAPRFKESLLELFFRKSKLYAVSGRRVLVTALSAGEQLCGAASLMRRLQATEELDLAVLLTEISGGVSLAAWSAEDELDLELLLAPFEVTGERREVSTHLGGAELPAVEEHLLEILDSYLPPPVTALQVASDPVAAVDTGVTVTEADEYFEEKGYSSGPVLEKGRVAGVITRRELQRALRSGLGGVPVSEFMNHDPVTAGPGISATALRRLFVERKTDTVILVNESDEPLGLVSPVDLLHYLYRLDRRPPHKSDQGAAVEVKGTLSPMEVQNMTAHFEELLPPSRQSLLLLLGQQASQMGVSVYLVGGVIRDLLLGRKPSGDLDFVVIPDAMDFAAAVSKFFDGELKLFERFGTASIFLREGLRLDFATARREIYDAPAALPRVQGTAALKRDLYRRDFTINTLACSLLPQSYGQLHDYFKGREDLQNRVIRTLYQLSFVDDPLRLLRGVRFEQRFGFSIEESTRKLMSKALQERVLEKVSRSRLAQEISLIYAESDPVAVLKRLYELGIFSFIYPRIYPDSALWQRLGRIAETAAWARQREWSHYPDEELLYLSGLLMEAPPQERLSAIRRLGLSRKRAGAVLQGCETVPPLLQELEEAGRDIRPSVLVGRLDPLYPEALFLLYALATSRAVKDNIRLYLESLQHVRPRLRGSSLEELGLQPGPLYGEIMKELRRAVLDGELRSAEEELDFIVSYLELQKEG